VVQKAAAIFHPGSASDVASCIKVLEHFQTPFAIRSGGHQTAKGAAAIKDGVLVSLDRLNSISYDTNTETVSFGPGNRWFAVYKHLEQYGRGVTGGHIGVVGSGGQITGGESTCPTFAGGALMTRRPEKRRNFPLHPPPGLLLRQRQEL
jgi:FAD/FMN-containing dehydrogenase